MFQNKVEGIIFGWNFGVEKDKLPKGLLINKNSTEILYLVLGFSLPQGISTSIMPHTQGTCNFAARGWVAGVNAEETELSAYKELIFLKWLAVSEQ